MKTSTSILFLAFFICYACTTKKVDETNHPLYPGHLFEYSENIEPRWSSFENLNGIKGQGGMENNGGKGHSHDMVKAGEHKVLLETNGSGIINRIWVTLRDRSPYALRGLVLNMYWDNEEKPAVSVPFGDFFGVGLGETAIFENALFANPEGRSFNSFVQMPFRKAARIEIVNEMDTDIQLVFFDIDFQQLKKWDENFMYFHAYWQRDTSTTLAEDFKILPEIKGKGRFIGSNVGVIAHPDYKDYWFGEGEAKVFLDGDT